MGRILAALKQLGNRGVGTNGTLPAPLDWTIVPHVPADISTDLPPPAATEDAPPTIPPVPPDMAVAEPLRGAPPCSTPPTPAVEITAADNAASDDNLLAWPTSVNEPWQEVLAVLATSMLARHSPALPMVLAFTSINEEPRKALLLVELAGMLAARAKQAGYRVLLVDGDWGRAELSARLWLACGMPNMLAEPPQHGWRQWRRQTSLPALDFLPAPIPWGPAQDAGGSAWRLDKSLWRPAKMVSEWRQEYGLVLMDVPPFCDPLLDGWMRLANGCYLVLRLGRTCRREVSAAVRTIDERSGCLLGCVAVVE